VLNYSFEDDQAFFVSPPSAWNFVNDGAQPGAPIVKTDFPIPTIDGMFCANVNGIAETQWRQILYSSPIQVAPGEHWSASTYVSWYADDSTAFGTVDLYLFWHANESDVPTIASLGVPASQELLYEIFTDGGSLSFWILMTQDQGFEAPEVPAGIGWMRVGLVTFITGNTDVFFDRVIARRIS
jgi:hypothetical protein